MFIHQNKMVGYSIKENSNKETRLNLGPN